MPQTIADVEFALSDSEHPADWEQPELNGQDQDEQVPEPKARYGVASNPEDAHELIDYRPTMPRRQYAEWYADRERERKRDDGELQRVRERAHEHFRDRTVVQKRLPEIEMRDATEPGFTPWIFLLTNSSVLPAKPKLYGWSSFNCLLKF